jgi:hypothetical protein
MLLPKKKRKEARYARDRVKRRDEETKRERRGDIVLSSNVDAGSGGGYAAVKKTDPMRCDAKVGASASRGFRAFMREGSGVEVQ